MEKTFSFLDIIKSETNGGIEFIMDMVKLKILKMERL